MLPDAGKPAVTVPLPDPHRVGDREYRAWSHDAGRDPWAEPQAPHAAAKSDAWDARVNAVLVGPGRTDPLDLLDHASTADRDVWDLDKSAVRERGWPDGWSAGRAAAIRERLLELASPAAGKV